MDGNKAQRLVLMLELLSRPGGVRAAELESRFELDARSLRRYLADLRDIDVPIVDRGRGDDRVLEVEARWRRSGVRLTLSEVLSLHFGRRLFTFLEGTTFASDMDGALERLEPAIARAHAELSRQLDRTFIAVPEPAKEYGGETSEIIDDLVTALLYRHPVDVRYRRADEIIRTYRLFPYTLAVYRQGLYLLARDVEAGQVKTFAVERIAELVRNHRERFEVPADWHPERYLASAFGITLGPPTQVVVAFSPAVRTLVEERRWHASATTHRRPDGWLEVHMTVAVTPELISWVLSFGRDARAVSPPELRARIGQEARAMAAAYASDGGAAGSGA